MKSELMKQDLWIGGVLRNLVGRGVEDFVLCAGSRNSPLLAILGSASGLDLFSHFEERSGAFFALGRARAKDRPVAIVTTSGTAVAECLPAVIEARYSGVPLVVVSADRPRRYRGTGAPQSIEQVGIFGPYAATLDLEKGEGLDLSAWSGREPLHLNLCLDEPLLEAPALALDFESPPALPSRDLVDLTAARREAQAFLARSRRPLVLVGALAAADRPAVAEFLADLGAPVWAEAISGLRENPALGDVLLASSERMLGRVGADAVLRLGGVPTCRYWRDLEALGLPVLSISSEPFSGSPGSRLLRAPVGALIASLEFSGVAPDAALRTLDRAAAERLRELYSRFPESEPALMHKLSRRIPTGSRIFLGNSLAIREWDLAADRRDRGFDCRANRGANGIDGEVSTFLGLVDEARSNWGIFGDLTSLYDLAAPWILPQLIEGGRDPELRIVVVNNGGGRIFSRLPAIRRHVPDRVRRRFFECEHPLDFEGWAKLWDLGYELSTQGLPPHEPGFRQGILELRPDAEQSEAFWREAAAFWDGLG